MAFRNQLRELCRDEHGQDLVEYSLLLAFIALAAVALLSGVGRNISKMWTSISGQVSNAAGS
jgi:Flp pilus assembly pilin Flp